MTDKLKFDDLLDDLHNKQSKLAEIICGDFVRELCISVYLDEECCESI